MNTPDLITICATSFFAVLFLLSLLALIIRVIILAFPEKVGEDDSAVIAAITTTYNAHYPGAKITKIGEEK
ncbi:MAG: hypothetical protein PVF17_11485 [Ignavibacteria bacterium]|jgi:hypothetical protein